MAEQAAPYLGVLAASEVCFCVNWCSWTKRFRLSWESPGRFLKLCPKLTALSLSGSRNLCTADGLQGLLQSWAGDMLMLVMLVE